MDYTKIIESCQDVIAALVDLVDAMDESALAQDDEWDGEEEEDVEDLTPKDDPLN